MKVTYIAHSCFVVELASKILVFDYFEGELPSFDAKKQLFFFASHHHNDHFSKNIFDYQQNAEYILSDDIYAKPNKAYLAVKPHQSYEFQGLLIETLKSTDEGVAYFILIDGVSIYHAGDLNWWHWKPDYPQEEIENQEMEKAYKQELHLLENKKIDVAFIPLDPRLEEAADWGLRELLNHCAVKYLFTMHMWKQYEIQQKCADLNQLQRIFQENQVFEVA